jgi:hypothetical protein
MFPDPGSLSLPASWSDDDDYVDPTTDVHSYFVDTGTGSIYPTDHLEELQRKVWENARRCDMHRHVPDLMLGPYGKEVPWPKITDFEALAEKSTDPAFWEFLGQSDTRSNEHRAAAYAHDLAPPLGWAKPIQNVVYTYLAIAIAKDLKGAQAYAAAQSSRRISKNQFLLGLQVYHEKLGAGTKSECPTLPVVADQYALLVASAAPGEFYPLERARAQKLTPSGLSVTTFPTALDFGRDVIGHVPEAWRRTDYNGAQTPTPERARSLAAGTALSQTMAQLGSALVGAGVSQPVFSTDEQVPMIHAVRFSNASGETRFYAMFDVFYNLVALIPGPHYTGPLTDAEKNQLKTKADVTSRDIEKARFAADPVYLDFAQRLGREGRPLKALQTLAQSK